MSTQEPITPSLLAKLPTAPGVYLFRNQKGEILYVGKAKSLRSRVRSYFRKDPSRSIKTGELVRRVTSVTRAVVAISV